MNVDIATSREDAEAAEAVRQHHARLAGTLALRTDALLRAVAQNELSVAEEARRRLVRWCEDELVPHAMAEEKVLYPAAQAMPEGRLLVTGMLEEHAVITTLVSEVADADDNLAAAAAGRALRVLVDSHLAKEDDLLLPLLTASPDVPVADLLAGMHELLGTDARTAHATEEPGLVEQRADEPAADGCGGACSCGHVDDPGFPVLDARAVPHAIRHATIFGALDAVPGGGGMVLVAPHDPLPLLAQVEERFGGAFETSYLERGPEAWRLVFLRASR